MISFDIECTNGHRFEGVFKDYNSYEEQLEKKMIKCPICESPEVKRLYTGCSIQPRSGSEIRISKDGPNMFEIAKMLGEYIKENFKNVGRDFADVTRAMYYGIEEERNIYGETTAEEVNELLDEGIPVIPILDVDKVEN